VTEAPCGAQAAEKSPYFLWNDRLFEHFFNVENAAQQVHLYVSQDLIDELSVEPPAPGDFLSALKEGPPEATFSVGICGKAIRLLNNWRAWSERPPYLAYLALFALAANSEQKWRPNRFYPGLREILGESGEGIYPGFRETPKLWIDLEKWCNIEQQGAFGLFRAVRVGPFPYVSYPLAQVILSHEERQGLNDAFETLGLGDEFQDDALLASALLETGCPLRPANKDILGLLAGGVATDLGASLIGEIRNELANWIEKVEGDQEAPRVGTAEGAPRTTLHTSRIRLPLKLCAKLDRLARTATFTLRPFAGGRSFEDEIAIEGPGGLLLTAEPQIEGWFSVLNASGNPFNAAELNWSSTYTFRMPGMDASGIFKGHSIRFFTTATPFGLPGYVESETPDASLFLSACGPTSSEELLRWAASTNVTVARLEFVGLPDRWRLYELSVRGDTSKVAPFPGLRFSHESARFKFIGGLHGPSGAYLTFAPPVVTVQAGDIVLLTANDREIGVRDGCATLTDAVNRDTQAVTLEALLENGEVLRRSIGFETEHLPRLEPSSVPLTIFGADVETGSRDTQVSGTIVSHSRFPIRSDVLLLYPGPVFWVGPNVGDVQETRNPNVALPATFKPSWIYVQSINKLFCIECTKPSRNGLVPKERRVLWKSFFCSGHGAEADNAQLLREYRSIADVIF
jgi:hypothetical protein